MSEPFLGEIRLFSFNQGGGPPKGWALCNGATMNIRQYSALYALLGVQFGGDGQTTFKLPDLRGHVPLGANLNSTKQPICKQGVAGGAETVTLSAATPTQLPPHNHALMAVKEIGNKANPAAHLHAQVPGSVSIYGAPTNTVALDPGTLSPAGGVAPPAPAAAGHDNMQPFVVLNYCIATVGYFPPRP